MFVLRKVLHAAAAGQFLPKEGKDRWLARLIREFVMAEMTPVSLLGKRIRYNPDTIPKIIDFKISAMENVAQGNPKSAKTGR